MKASNFAVQAEADWILPSLKSLLLAPIEAVVVAVAPVRPRRPPIRPRTHYATKGRRSH